MEPRTLSFQAPGELADAVERYARANDRKVSEVIRAALRVYLSLKSAEAN